MQARDVLGELAHGTISPGEVEAIYDRIMDSHEAGDAARLLGLSNVEWTGYGQGASFEQLSKWRFTGWPTQCAVCKKPLAAESFGWLVAEIEGQFTLQHIECPD